MRLRAMTLIFVCAAVAAVSWTAAGGEREVPWYKDPGSVVTADVGLQ